MFTNNNQASLFSNSSTNANDQDMAMESKFQTRQEAFLNEENFSALKENEMTKELSLGQNMRNKIFMQKRLKKSVNSEQSQSLKSKLTIPLDLYENCGEMQVEISQFKQIIDAFKSQDITQKYSG